MPQPLGCTTHNWCFLRNAERTIELPRDEHSVYHRVENYDMFFCSHCLEYNEIVTKRKEYVIVKVTHGSAPYKPTWDVRLETWWYNLTHKHSAKEAPKP